jgi:hypothetical protein
MLPDRLFMLKGQGHEFLGFKFSHDSSSSGPLAGPLSFECYSFVFKLVFSSQILSPWLGDIVDFGIRFSYRPASLRM